uniref:RING-type domain-containing protein n=1 Tax=viral metagenome TaxID=1070528 RepID=A0A6C0IH31_9ZZZZ
MATKPSERWCKHGFLNQGERYNQLLHKYGDTIEDRCDEYYTPEEIERMKSEIKVAECAICMEEIADTENCRSCLDGHKFHNTCITDYWTRNPDKQNICPVTNSIPNNNIPNKGWQGCRSVNDINSGGRRRKTTNRKRKSSKKSNKKKRKSYKKSYKKRT